jgi:hypothetical protein
MDSVTCWFKALGSRFTGSILSLTGPHCGIELGSRL